MCFCWDGIVLMKPEVAFLTWYQSVHTLEGVNSGDQWWFWQQQPVQCAAAAPAHTPRYWTQMKTWLRPNVQQNYGSEVCVILHPQKAISKSTTSSGFVEQQMIEAQFGSASKTPRTVLTGSTQIHRQSCARNNQLALLANVRVLRLAVVANWFASSRIALGS